MDVKDAYLCVPQPEDEPVVVTAPRSYVNKFGASKTWKLGRVLPGQRRGAQEWYHQLAGDLNNASLESMPEVPTLYRASGEGERYVAQVPYVFLPTKVRSLPTSRKDSEGRKRAVVACDKGLECTCFTGGSMGKPLKISEVKACDDESDLTSRRTLASNHWH